MPVPLTPRWRPGRWGLHPCTPRGQRQTPGHGWVWLLGLGRWRRPMGPSSPDVWSRFLAAGAHHGTQLSQRLPTKASSKGAVFVGSWAPRSPRFIPPFLTPPPARVSWLPVLCWDQSDTAQQSLSAPEGDVGRRFGVAMGLGQPCQVEPWGRGDTNTPFPPARARGPGWGCWCWPWPPGWGWPQPPRGWPTAAGSVGRHRHGASMAQAPWRGRQGR